MGLVSPRLSCRWLEVRPGIPALHSPKESSRILVSVANLCSCELSLPRQLVFTGSSRHVYWCRQDFSLTGGGLEASRETQSRYPRKGLGVSASRSEIYVELDVLVAVRESPVASDIRRFSTRVTVDRRGGKDGLGSALHNVLTSGDAETCEPSAVPRF